MLKKLFLPLLAVLALGTSIISTPVYATDKEATSIGECTYLLGMRSWNCGLPEINSEDSLKAGIWQIVANVFNDITVIAAYLVIAYIVYGGYQYIFSGGEVGKVATGKKTLNQAFIGLAIVMSANIIVNAITGALNGGLNPESDPNAVSNIFWNGINWVIGVSGLVSVIFVVGGGIAYMTSAGDPSKLQKAKNMIKYALIGLAIAALAETIFVFMFNTIDKAQSGYNIEKGNQNEISQIA